MQKSVRQWVWTWGLYTTCQNFTSFKQQTITQLIFTLCLSTSNPSLPSLLFAYICILLPTILDNCLARIAWNLEVLQGPNSSGFRVLPKFSPNYDVKNMISTYTKDLSWEKMDHIHQISKKKNSTSQSLMITYSRYARIQKDSVFFDFHIYYVAKYGKIISWMIATFATSQNPENKPWYKFKWVSLGEHANPFQYTSWQGTGSTHLFFGEKSPNGIKMHQISGESYLFFLQIIRQTSPLFRGGCVATSLSATGYTLSSNHNILVF